jgi:molybdopterin-containing oxidoreductase family iron-sulfur binding subunit
MDKEPKSGIGDVCPGKKHRLELGEVRAKLEKARGPQYWRTLDELAQTPEFEEMLHREFPKHASEWTDKSSRRDFMKIMGASLALAGLSACTKQPMEAIVPYVRQPNNQVLGKPLFYATAMALGAYGTGLLVESHEGRPTKIEGNPQHPSSLGGTDVFNQASVLTMYDPDRSQTNAYVGATRTWTEVLDGLRVSIAAEKAKGGAGLRVLSGATSSPAFVAQMQEFLKAYPQAKWYQWEALNRDNVYAGAEIAFGEPVESVYDLTRAKVLLSLDGDFLSSGFPGFHKYTRQFSQRRRPELKDEMLRFYAVESATTNTAAKADHRLHVKASQVEGFARALATALGLNQAGGEFTAEQKRFAAALMKDLQANRGAALVMVGDAQTAATHALAHAMNAALGAVGKTVNYIDPVDPFAATGKVEQLRQLTAEMRDGKVDMLVVLNTNPVYDAPVDMGFLDALNRVGLRVHLGLYRDETAKYCHWHVSGTHYLEQWGDTRTFDGTVSFVQPLIAPLYGGHSESELIEFLINANEATSYALTQRYWQTQHGSDFNTWWSRSLHDGFVAGSAFAPKTIAVKKELPSLASEYAATEAVAGAGGLEVIFRRDATLYDGRFANNGWLQETPKPMTQICWDNPVLMSVATAKKLKLKSEDEVELELNGHKVKGAIWITPGHPDDAVTVTLGSGRENAGRVGAGVGFSGYRLRASHAMWFAGGLGLRATGGHFGLASPQGHQSMEGRAIVRAATLEEFVKNPGFAHEMVEAPPVGLTLYEPYEYKEYKWGMAIDLNSCVGCKTCEIACQAENNIAVVGKDQVKRGRIMHWLRIDNYHEGSPENPNTYFQPVPCMQCENAPCELVCPVGATTHSSEGLNDMVYNRCVGTRYCSNNCPYKVRRFNFLLFSDFETTQLKFQRNPEVTVRSRGVMEKCTYCVQRITHARIGAEEQNRKVRDGELMTACQQACPAGAIIFGDLNDPESRVAKLKAQERNYGLLEELNTRPRTTYMAAVRNPNPELES